MPAAGQISLDKREKRGVRGSGGWRLSRATQVVLVGIKDKGGGLNKSKVSRLPPSPAPGEVCGCSQLWGAAVLLLDKQVLSFRACAITAESALATMLISGSTTIGNSLDRGILLCSFVFACCHRNYLGKSFVI